MLKQLNMPFFALILLCVIKPVLASNTSVGELEFVGADGQPQTALLLNTAISGEVNGMIASLVVEQHFQNTSSDWVNGRYVFPLSESAAVDGLQIQIGERIIDAVVKAKADAKKTYEKAKREGKKAGLVEQHRANLFSMAVANIAPGEKIIARITLVDKVRYQDQTFSLNLPTTITPRYIPGAPIKLTAAQRADLEGAIRNSQTRRIDPASGWARNTTQVPDASDITPPQKYSDQQQGDHRFSLNLRLNAGLNLPSVSSNTHAIISREVSALQYEVSLADQTSLMNKDLVLHWTPQIGGAPEAAFFEQESGGNYYAMVMLTPPQLNTRLSLPRDVTFIVDSSGSMAGQSMAQAKQALTQGLSYLSANDRFNIIDFDSDFRALFERSAPVSPRSLKLARAMVSSLHADGGTEMRGALNFALSQNSNESALRQIIFITDGAVGNERELFKLIATQLGDARLFTVGIGSAPNAFFMNKAATFGRGSYTYIRDIAQVQQQMTALFDKISAPVMRDVTLQWPGRVEQFPKRIPDLYAGQPIQVLVKSSTPMSKVKASGVLLDTPWQQDLELSNNTQQNANIDTVWARANIAHLMDQLALGELAPAAGKEQITALGIEHSIVSKFTSLVAVEQAPSRPLGVTSKHKNVPSLMPHGSAMPIPQTASWSSVFSSLGSLILLLSGYCARRRRANHSVSLIESSEAEA